MKLSVFHRLNLLNRTAWIVIGCSFGILICAAGGPFPTAVARSAAAANKIADSASGVSKGSIDVTPFTLRTRVYVYDEQDSKRPHKPPQLTLITARRSDGATAMLSYRDGQSAAGPRMRSIRYLDGSLVDVYPSLHAVTKWPADSQRFAFLNKLITDPRPHCSAFSGYYFAGYTNLGGVKAAILKEFPKGSSGTTWWRAPALGCEALQQAYTQAQPDGSFRLVSETKFVSLKLGEPDASLFAVPSDYPAIKPSEALRWWAKREGRKWGSDLQAQAEREDAQYARLQRESHTLKNP